VSDSSDEATGIDAESSADSDVPVRMTQTRKSATRSIAVGLTDDEGVRPVMPSAAQSKKKRIGWRVFGQSINIPSVTSAEMNDIERAMRTFRIRVI
jgi:hypothetical protein